MREWLINRLQIPQRAVLNRKIPKKTFFTRVDLSTREKEMLSSQIEGIFLLSIMNQQSMNIPLYKEGEFNYAEVVWIYVELRTYKNVTRVISAVHKSIFNPVVLIVGSSEGQILLSTSHKRLSKNDKTKIVIEQPTITDWFNPREENTAYSNLLNALVVSNLSFENLYSIYEDIHHWIICEELIQLIGAIPVHSDNRKKVIKIFNDVQVYRKEVKQLHQEQKTQLDFGAKIDLHMKIKQQEQRINIQLQQIKELC